jgi:hypothetical protein
MSLMLLAPIPWAGRVWALPFLTALVSSERACRERGHRHKALLDVGRQMALQVRRWLPGRDLVLVGDSAFSALLFLDALHRGGITVIPRLRLDAASTIQRLQGFPVRSGAHARRGCGGQPCPRS